ncbi:MAG: CHRD domain-containing protein [Bryobacteraceae bacterium]
MNRLLATLVLSLSCAGLSAQTVESIPFRVVLSPLNEVPPLTGLDASGSGTLWAHVVRQANGRITSASFDFKIKHNFAEEVRITGLHVHRGAAGVNGPVVIDSGIAGGDRSILAPAGQGAIFRQAQITDTSSNAGMALVQMIDNPSGFYINLHTAANPAGAIRGQVEAAERVVLMSFMAPFNEVPPVQNLNARAIGTLVALITRAPNGNITSAEVTFDVNYRDFPEGTAFTGLHIHSGPGGVNGPVTIDSGIRGGANAVPAHPSGTGNLRYEVEAPLTANAVRTLYGLLNEPNDFYLNLHTTANPAGAVRGQLYNTDEMTFQMNMLPSNEVPPVTSLDASARAAFELRTIRDRTGDVIGGVGFFNVNHRFPGETRFTGLHVHVGAAGVNGPVRIDSGIVGANPVISATGFGNIYRMATISSQTALEAANALVRNPENYYLNLHTTVNPPGAVRDQLAPANTALPVIGGTISAVSDPQHRTLAPGGLITIFGFDLAKTPTSLAGLIGSDVPNQANGTAATIAGLAMPLVAIGREPGLLPPDYIVAQVPFGVPPGTHPVVVQNANGASQPVQVQVAANAPGIFFDRQGAIAFVTSTGEMIRRSRPAEAGEELLIIATGLGQTTPPLSTGIHVPPSPRFSTVPVSATLGGQQAQVVSSSAMPDFIGLYSVVIRVPSGLTPGAATLTIRAGDATSNAVMLPVR